MNPVRSGHPDLCPYCCSPISEAQRERIGREHPADYPRPRCICPIGFGQVADPRCPLHGNRAPAHTITGLPPGGAR